MNRWQWFRSWLFSSQTTQVLLVGAFLLWTVLGIMRIPQCQTDLAVARREITAQQRPELVNEYRRTLLQIAGGLVVAVGLYLTYRRIQASERANQINEEANLASAEASRETLRVAEEGQVTERFTRAIEQLGSGETAIRLGGIYALERIARDSEKDHWTVMEVLSAFIREKATMTNNHPLYVDDPEYDGLPWERPIAAYEVQTDVQAALTVIGRREQREEPDRLNLRNVWLRGYNAVKAHLERASLRGAHLERAYLYETRLKRADLREAHLEDAYLTGAHLERTNLYGVHLEHADLLGAHLGNAHLIRAHLEGAHLIGAYLIGAHLERAYLGGAHLEDTSLYEAHLEGTYLIGAHLEGAHVRSVDLQGTRCPPGTFVGAIIDGIRYEEGMPDPREGWPPPEPVKEDAAPKPSEQEKTAREGAEPVAGGAEEAEVPPPMPPPPAPEPPPPSS